MDAETVRKSIDILALIGGATTLKKVASCEGGEYCGSCPFCRGQDRFRVQPSHKDGGRWYCRKCGDGKWHDVFDYVQRLHHTDFLGAMEILTDKDKPAPTASIAVPAKENESEQSQEIDRDKWTDAAGAFIADCIIKLWSDIGAQARDYLHTRGLTDDTLHKWKIGYYDLDGYDTPSDWGLPPGLQMRLHKGIVIPCRDAAGLHYIKIRRSSGEPRYPYLKGSKFYLYGAQNLKNTCYATIFESELDALLAWQTGYNIGACAMPAGQTLKPEWQPLFDRIDDIVVAYDNDDPGQQAADKLCKLAHFWKAPLVPRGKDLTEFYQQTHSQEAVFEYLYDALGVINHG
jgi:DNA primase